MERVGPTPMTNTRHGWAPGIRRVTAPRPRHVCTGGANGQGLCSTQLTRPPRFEPEGTPRRIGPSPRTLRPVPRPTGTAIPSALRVGHGHMGVNGPRAALHASYGASLQSARAPPSTSKGVAPSRPGSPLPARRQRPATPRTRRFTTIHSGERGGARFKVRFSELRKKSISDA